MGKKTTIAAVDVSQMVDMHLRWGLEDDIIRIPRKAFGVLLETLVLQAEDVVLRCVYPEHGAQHHPAVGNRERLHGGQALQIHPRTSVYNLVLVSEWRARILEEQGHGKGQ